MKGFIRAMALSTAVLAGVSFAALTDQGSAHENVTGVVKERHDAMKMMKDHFMPLVQMVKGAAPFDAATVKKNAAIIAAELEKASKMFPKGSDKGETRAKPEIWQNEAEFQALFKTAIEKARALENVSAPDQLAPAVMALGGKGCKACHEKFRKPKEKKM